MLPGERLNGPHFTSDAARTQYVIDNDLHELPDELPQFLSFYE